MKRTKMKLINYYGNANLTGIYMIRNLINNKVYIGSTKKSFISRKIRHLGLLRKNIHYNEHLQNAWNYYGEQNFSFEILFICSPNECEKHEGEFIKLYSSNNRNFGYNIASVSSYKYNYELSNNHNIEKSIRKIKKSLTLDGFNVKERGISKPFKVYDLNGNFIKEYSSAKEFILKNGGSKSHISHILNKRKLFYRKTIILFSNDNLTHNDIINAKKMDIKKINLFVGGQFKKRQKRYKSNIVGHLGMRTIPTYSENAERSSKIMKERTMTYIISGISNGKPFLMSDCVGTQKNGNGERVFSYTKKLDKLISANEETYFCLAGADSYGYAINIFD